MRRSWALVLFLAACRFSPDPLSGEEPPDGIAAGDAPGPASDALLEIDAPAAFDATVAFDAAAIDAMPTSSDAATVACGVELAPAGYDIALPGGSSCYRVDADPEWWIDAQNDCLDDGAGAHLVVLDDLVENQFVHRIKTPGQNVWIGVSDRVDEGVYLWVTDQATTILPLPWHTGKGTNSSEDCVELRDPDALWNDHDCFDAFNSGYKRRYVCEYDGLAADPTNY